MLYHWLWHKNVFVTQISKKILTCNTDGVALGTGIGTTAKNMLQGCASKPEYYFNSPTTNDLTTAFNQIDDSLANLRISK